MNRKKVDKIIDQLFYLQKDQVEEIKAACDLILSSGKKRNISEDQAEFYSRIVAILRKNNVPFIPTLDGKTRSPKIKGFSYEKFVDAYNSVVYFSEQLDLPRRGPKKILWYDLLLECCCNYIRSREGTVGIKSLLECLNALEDVIEESYPGYIRSGLLPSIIRDRDGKALRKLARKSADSSML